MSDVNDPNATHEYDGIIEHNHPMPGWWVWTFILTVIFAALYYLHYEVAKGPTLKDELAIAMKEYEKNKKIAATQFPELNETELLARFANQEMTILAEGALKSRCTVCHGEKLEGKIGPALLDQTWIHGTGAGPDIVKVIREGVGAKGMPPWEGILSRDEIFAIAAYIAKHKAK